MAAARSEHSWLPLLSRLLVGGTFVVAAGLELMAPAENFQAAINAFQLLPTGLERPVALTLPWIELIAGAFCLLGLYTRWSAFVLMGFLLLFTSALAWSRIKGIDLQHCGCFGRWDFVQTPGLLLARDSVLLVLTLPLLRRQRFWLS